MWMGLEGEGEGLGIMRFQDREVGKVDAERS